MSLQRLAKGHDPERLNDDHPHERPRATRRYVALSVGALAAAGVAAIIAVAIWPHDHGTATPAGATRTSSPAPSASTPKAEPSKSRISPTTRPSTASNPGTARTPAAAENLVIPDDVRAQLLTAFAAAKHVQLSDIAGTRPGWVYYGYLPATDTYWAVADFWPSRTASLQTRVDFQDGASLGVFHHRTGQPWQVAIGGIPWPCPGDLPDAMRSVWDLPISGGCVIVSASAPDRGHLTTSITLPDGTYYGAVKTLQYDYDGTASMLFDPYTWGDGSNPVDNQPGAWDLLGANARTATRNGTGTGGGLAAGVFDKDFAQGVASAMPQFAGHPNYGYIVSVQNHQITSMTQVGPLNPMPASHPSYIEPTG